MKRNRERQGEREGARKGEGPQTEGERVRQSLQKEKEEETLVCLKPLSGKYLAPKLISLFDQKRGVEN